jgi:hypothetical protein
LSKIQYCLLCNIDIKKEVVAQGILVHKNAFNQAGRLALQAGQQGRLANKAGRPTSQAGQQVRQANKAGRKTRQAGQQGRQANRAGRQTTRQAV